jgi:hypothetical protein
MNLNRKSSKATTKVSFVISVIMLVGLAVSIETHLVSILLW